MESPTLPTQLAVSGYYGCGNTGDEAVLAGIRESFARRSGESVRLLALSQHPAETLQLHNIPAFDRMRLASLRHALHDSEMLLSGGGSLLQDTTSVRSLLYYLWVMRLAYSMHVPYMFYAQGIGPLRRAMSRRLTRLVANRATYITVRDEESARLLQQIGVNAPTIEVTADPAFALSPAPKEAVAALRQAEGLPSEERMVGVALRAWGGHGESPVANYARLLEELRRQCGMRIILLPMQVPGDVLFAESVVAQTDAPDAFPIVRHAYPPDTLLGLVSEMQAVVAMRLHALIFAARVATPLFALSYDPKVESLMHSLGRSDALESWRGFDPTEVAARVAAQIQDRPAYVASLQAHLPEREALALRNADCALTLIQRRRAAREALFI